MNSVRNDKGHRRDSLIYRVSTASAGSMYLIPRTSMSWGTARFPSTN